jgi:ParB-like chromosome segregation protein Spo0J
MVIRSPKVRSNRLISFEMLPLSSIKSNPNNAREHDRKQLTKLVRSISKYGFNAPLVVDETNQLLCGHARVLAAARLGIEEIPVVRASHLSESQKRGYVLADNKLAELASWNRVFPVSNHETN